MMSVLHIIEELSAVGGTPRKLLSLLKHGNGRHQFLSMRRGSLDEQFAALTNTRILHSTNPARLTRAAINLVREQRIDVISTHFTRAFVCGYVASRITATPLVHNEHGPALDRQSGGGSRLGAYLRLRLLKNARAVICNSAYTASTVRSRFAVPAGLVQVIHNPVETRFHARTERRHRDNADPVVLGHIGGMIPVRDQQCIIRSVQLLRAAGRTIRLVLIGDGPLRGALENTARSIGVSDCIEFRGYTTELNDFFQEIDLYVNAAIGEGFGIAVVEAMLAGAPVILANAGAHPELVRHEQTGVLFEPGSPEALCSAIEWALADWARSERLGQAGQRWASSVFHPERYANAYEQVLSEVLNGRTTRLQSSAAS